MNILGLDPGFVNFAAAQVYTESDIRFEIKYAGLLKHTIHDLKVAADVNGQVQSYRKELVTLSKGADEVVVERFMVRGRFGAHSEYIGAMIGLIFAHHEFVTPITAASWKNCIGRRFDLKMFYKTLRCPPHPVDAALMALYLTAIRLGKKPFSDWTYHTCLEFKEQIENSFDGNLRNVRDMKRFLLNLKASFK